MIRLQDTTGNDISAAITAQRHRIGAPATGMVLTLLVLADEHTQADATLAATEAAHEHPMRILVLVPRPDSPFSRLDADVSVGGDDGPGEVVVARLRGDLSEHAGPVAIPLLLPDTPVVAWWPHGAPPVPAEDSIGSHAQRRITTSMANADQLAALQGCRDGYRPGDADLAWTQITNIRSALAAVLDTTRPTIRGAEIRVRWAVASAHLLAAWLHSRLDIPVCVIPGDGPGITDVRLIGEEGDIRIRRPDGRSATLDVFDRPAATIALRRREYGELLAEELRRLAPDEIYGETLGALDEVGDAPLSSDDEGDGDA